MILFVLLLPIALAVTYITVFPKTKGVLQPIKVEANKKHRQ